MRKMQKKLWQNEKCENFAKKYGREIINYNIIKLLTLSSQSREFFTKLFFLKFRENFFRLIQLCEKVAKYGRIFSHFFVFFE